MAAEEGLKTTNEQFATSKTSAFLLGIADSCQHCSRQNLCHSKWQLAATDQKHFERAGFQRKLTKMIVSFSLVERLPGEKLSSAVYELDFGQPWQDAVSV